MITDSNILLVVILICMTCFGIVWVVVDYLDNKSRRDYRAHVKEIESDNGK